MVWYGMVWYGMVWHGMVWYGKVWYGMHVWMDVCMDVCMHACMYVCMYVCTLSHYALLFAYSLLYIVTGSDGLQPNSDGLRLAASSY